MSVPKRMRFEIFRRDGFRCRYCGATPEQSELRPDHVIPEALGGKTEPANLATACNDCNSGKSSIAPDSATVADVDERATRWAHALADAARQVEQDYAAVARRHDWFAAEWNTWTHSGGKRFDLPADWLGTIDALTKAGLTQTLIVGAVKTAMSGEHIRDRFRYFCGVCWRIADEISEVAETIVAVDAMVPTTDPWATAVDAPSTAMQLAVNVVAAIEEHFGKDAIDQIHRQTHDPFGTPEQEMVNLALTTVNYLVEACANPAEATA